MYNARRNMTQFQRRSNNQIQRSQFGQYVSNQQFGNQFGGNQFGNNQFGGNQFGSGQFGSNQFGGNQNGFGYGNNQNFSNFNANSQLFEVSFLLIIYILTIFHSVYIF